jgi:hypothetical protein
VKTPIFHSPSTRGTYTALGILGLSLAGLWYVGGGAILPAKENSVTAELSVLPPVTHENLTVFFVRGHDTVVDLKVATLQEAMDAGWAVVHETGRSDLTVENCSSEYELFVQEGDIIRGGKQDRMIARDMLLPPKSGLVSFPCHCVESGRSSARGNEATTHFNKSDQFAVSSHLKYANATGQQGEVWNGVAEEQTKLSRNLQTNVTSNASPSSLQLTLENPAVKDRITAYQTALQPRGENEPNILGAVFFVNGEMSGAELYGSNALFQSAWPKLLRAAATEALAEKQDRNVAHVPTVVDVERFLAHAGQFEAAPHRHDSRDPSASWRSIPIRYADAIEIADRIKVLYRHTQVAGQPTLLTVNVDDRTNTVFLYCAEWLFDRIKRMVQTQLDVAEVSNPTSMMVVSLNEIDPALVQQAIDAIQDGNQPSPPIPLPHGGGIGGLGTIGCSLQGTTLSSLGSTPQITAPSSSRADPNTINASSFLRMTSAMPLYQGIRSNASTDANQPSGFGTPLFGTSVQVDGRAVTTRRMGRIIVEGTEITGDRVVQNQLELDRGNAMSPAAEQPSRPDGNHLTINRVENAAGLVTESRDATRQNALIHKSYIKLGSRLAGTPMP